MFSILSRKQDSEKRRPGACASLAGDYQTIGSALLRYEQETPGYSYRSVAGFSEFREGVAFINVEMLDSYLEDLLNVSINDDDLFITREVKSSFLHTRTLQLVGVLSPIVLYVCYLEAILSSSFSLAAFVGVLSLLPLIAFSMFPQLRLARRMRFAMIVQQEISRRRGIRKDGGSGAGIFHNLEELLGSGNQGLQGAARWMYH